MTFSPGCSGYFEFPRKVIAFARFSKTLSSIVGYAFLYTIIPFSPLDGSGCISGFSLWK